MFVIFAPFLTLAMFVSVRSAGVVGNDVLLLLLTLSGAVLSGINGFGRRMVKASSLSPAMVKSAGVNARSITWSTRSSSNA